MESGQANPRDIKFLLAEELVDRFHGAGQGACARERFVRQFQKHQIPEDMPEKAIQSASGSAAISWVLRDAFDISTSEARRKIKEGAVRIDGERVEAVEREIKAGKAHVVQLGKRRFAKLVQTFLDPDGPGRRRCG